MTLDPLGGLDVQALIDSFPYYVMLIDEDHRIVMANHAVRRHLGVLPEDLVGRRCPEAVHGVGTSEFAGCPLPQARATGEDAEALYYDEAHGVWIESAVYPTGFTEGNGRRLFVHVARASKAAGPEA